MADANDTALKIPYYVTDKGLLVNLKTDRPKKHLINDTPLTPTFNPRWWLVEGQSELLSYSEHAGSRSINKRYVLINTSVQGTPAMIPADEVTKDCDYDWTGKYAGLQSLYRYEYDTEDLGFEPRQFEVQNLGSLLLNNLGDPTTFSCKVHGTGFTREAQKSTSKLEYLDIFKDYDWAA